MAGDERDPGEAQAPGRWSRRSALAGVAAGFGLAGVGAGAVAGAVAIAGRPLVAPAAPVAAAPVGRRVGHLYLTIVSGRMLHKPGWPMAVPADFTVPAHADVTVTIRNFDGGAAAVPTAYLAVQGIQGAGMQVLAATEGAAAATLRRLPAGGASHTFTVSGLHLNVPVPPASTVTFRFRTGAPATYAWQCFAPCGTGKAGWAGPMADGGYMQGKMTVAI